VIDSSRPAYDPQARGERASAPAGTVQSTEPPRLAGQAPRTMRTAGEADRVPPVRTCAPDRRELPAASTAPGVAGAWSLADGTPGEQAATAHIARAGVAEA